MDAGIGATLREARNRRKIGLSEVEDATKIRLRYLRAIENEEWDVLPGGPYTRSFIRTYASFLGLDGERLADDYRRDEEGAPAGGREPRAEPPAASPRLRARRPRLSTRALATIVTLGLVAALVAIGLSTGGGSMVAPAPTHRQRGAFHARAVVPIVRRPPGVSVRLAADAEVWVCLLDASGRRLIDGRILGAGAQAGPFHSGSFTVSFGNGEVEMRIDGRDSEIPESASPLGYEVGPGGDLSPLSEAERPTCT